MRQYVVLSSILAVLIYSAIGSDAKQLECRAGAAPACIYNFTSKIFKPACTSVITKYDAYQPKAGRQCNRVNGKCLWGPYTSTTGNCRLVVDNKCTIIERRAVCKTSDLCKTSRCSWPGDPRICKGAACRFKGGFCNSTPEPNGTACWDETRMRDRPCLKGVCNGNGKCDMIGRDKEDCSSESNVESCLKGVCRNDTCVTSRAPSGTICSNPSWGNRPFNCLSTCCQRVRKCNTLGVCVMNTSLLPPAGTPCIQTATPCRKGACDGRGKCEDQPGNAPPGWPCVLPDFDAYHPIAQCNMMQCDANAQCIWVNVQDGQTCSSHQSVPDPYSMLPPKLPIQPRPPAPPFVPPNVTGTCHGYCYRGECKEDVPGLCDDEICYTPPDCEISPSNPCSCYRDACLRCWP